MADHWRRLQELFAEALALAPAQRDAWIAARCEGDEALARDLAGLLANADTDAPLVATIAEALASMSSAAPARIGPYRLGALIGAGGMGTVYRATRDDAEFTRDVAIKVLRPFASAEHVARFRDERQILATLDHPAIVKLLDGGRTDDGLPYLVMDRIDGVPITTWARDRTIRERVELIARVAAGVGYAHGKLVVHRDLKPSNLLVQPDGAPKLLDFGIAKLLDGEREAPDTLTGMPLLTPEYASPEQARGEPITVATDIYSLGAVFYEVLVGRPPQATGASVMDTLAAICEQEPPRPGISRDLDSIVLKALQKRPADRYASIAELVADLERYLEGRPVHARAATIRYRAGKFVVRNAGKLAVAGVMACALVGAAAVSVVQARRATEAARAANAERVRLVYERGWQEVASGRAAAALPWLVRALAAEDTPAVRFSLAEALRPFERELAVVPFPGGAGDGAWLDDERFVIFGRGGLAIHDRDGRPLGAPVAPSVWTFAPGPNGALAIALDDRVIVRDASGAITREVPASVPVRVAVLPDGTLVIVEVGRLRLVRDATLVDRPLRSASSLAVSHDRIAIGAGEGTLHVLDHTGTELFTTVSPGDGGIGVVRFAAGGRIVTAARNAKVWSARGELLSTFAGHNSFVESMAVDRSGMRVATGGRDGTAKVWSLERGFVAELRGHEFGVVSVDFSPDGTRLLTTGGDNTHRVWDLASGHLELQIEGRIGSGSAPSAQSGTRAGYFAPAGDRILAIAGTSAKLVRVDRGALQRELDTGRHHQPRAAAFRPDEREIAIAGLNQLEIWRPDGTRVAAVPVGDALLWSVAWTPDGSRLGIAGVERASLVDRATLAEIPLVGHAGRVVQIQFARDGRRAVTAGGDRTARIWDVASARELATLPHPGGVSAAIWDRAGARIVTACADGRLRVWDAATYAQTAELDVGTRYLDVALSPDEKRLAMAGHDGTIAIWDLAGRRRLVELTGHTGPVTTVAWSPDGALLASSADDQTARVWDPVSGKQLGLRRHRDGAMSVAWSANGELLLTASTDGSVRLWDAHRETRSAAELEVLAARLR